MPKGGVYIPLLALFLILVFTYTAYTVTLKKGEFKRGVGSIQDELIRMYQQAEQDNAFLYFVAQRAYDDTMREFASKGGVNGDKCSAQSRGLWQATCIQPDKDLFKTTFTKHLKTYQGLNQKLSPIVYDILLEEEGEKLIIRVVPEDDLTYTLRKPRSPEDERNVEVTYSKEVVVVLAKENPFTPYRRIYTQLKEDRKCLQEVNPIEKSPNSCISEKFGFAWNLEKQKKEDNLIKGEVVLQQKVIVKEKETFIEKPVTILFTVDLNNL